MCEKYDLAIEEKIFEVMIQFGGIFSAGDDEAMQTYKIWWVFQTAIHFADASDVQLNIIYKKRWEDWIVLTYNNIQWM